MSKAEDKLAEELARKIVHHVVNNQPDDINEPEWKALALQVAALLEPHLVGESAIRANERKQILARIEPLMPRYDEFDNFHPAGTDVDPRYAAGWNAVYAILEETTKVAPPKGEQSA